MTDIGCWKNFAHFYWPIDSDHIAGERWYNDKLDIQVLISKSTMENGSKWVHISVSKEERLPTWEEMTIVKDHFVGENATACHVIPSKADYVNLHSYCLHMWSPLNGGYIPNLQDLVMETAWARAWVR